MKDEPGIKVKKVLNLPRYPSWSMIIIDYYNNDRYQMDLANLSPNEFLSYYRTGVYPLKAVIDELEDTKKKIEKLNLIAENQI